MTGIRVHFLDILHLALMGSLIPVLMDSQILVLQGIQNQEPMGRQNQLVGNHRVVEKELMERRQDKAPCLQNKVMDLEDKKN
jgi:hypothetical protein